MSLEEKMKEVLNEERDREKNPNFKNLRDFYCQMKKEGVAIKQDYTLPPVDTIGREYYRSIENKVDKRQK